MIVRGKANDLLGTVYVVVQLPVPFSAHTDELNEPPALPSLNARLPTGVLSEEPD